MTRNRYKAIFERGQPLHAKERKRGWHLCNELDGDLVKPMPFCNCNQYGKRKQKRIQKQCDKEMRRWENKISMIDSMIYAD